MSWHHYINSALVPPHPHILNSILPNSHIVTSVHGPVQWGVRVGELKSEEDSKDMSVALLFLYFVVDK